MHAVIAAFHPEAGCLVPLVEALLQQVAVVHVIDNTPSGAVGIGNMLALIDQSRLNIARMSNNVGVASAFNVGIRAAMAVGASHVLLSDQDSLPLKGMVARLVATVKAQEALGRRVAVVGPDFRNDVDDHSFRFRGLRRGAWVYPAIRPSGDSPVIDVAAVISSGALIPREALEVIGLMRDDLFVDYVDIEWCERARRLGYVCLADGRATMQHRMGEEQLTFWLFHQRTVARYGPVRLRYQARNAVYLATRPGVALPFRTGVLSFLAAKLYAYTAKRDGAAVRALGRGVLDGFSGKLGPF